MTPKVYHLRVFADGPNGGNPLPVVIDAEGMKNVDMQAVAESCGHESGFVFPPPSNSVCDFEFHYWVPEHEMEMCGHATVGALWLLEKLGRLSGNYVRILTRSGIVEANVKRGDEGVWVEISQNLGVVSRISTDSAAYQNLLSTLGIEESSLALGYPIQNSKTSRAKTMIPLSDVDILSGLQPRFDQVEKACKLLGSTGLYPYARQDDKVFCARQFPKKSGYPEDAATGIAAAALAFALLENGLVGADDEVTVKQGQAMGAPSSIAVRFKKADGSNGRIIGCWIGGTAILEDDDR